MVSTPIILKLNLVYLKVLGPLLFFISINDLERNIKSNVNFFADDTMLFSIVKDPVISAKILNRDLDIIHQWAQQWKLEFKFDPTKQAPKDLFSYTNASPNHHQLIFNGTAVVKVNEHKYLGLILFMEKSLIIRRMLEYLNRFRYLCP